MNTKTKDIILYDNYPCIEREQYAKENLFINNPELYKTITDIPQKDIKTALYWLDMQEWEEIKAEFEVLFKQDDYLLATLAAGKLGLLAESLFATLRTYNKFLHTYTISAF